MLINSVKCGGTILSSLISTTERLGGSRLVRVVGRMEEMSIPYYEAK